VSAFTEKDTCAQVDADLLTCCCKFGLHVDCVIARRKSSEDGPSKTTEQQLAAKQAISYVAAASVPPPAGETCLIVYSNAEARHSAQ
jgi:hypothetical protein